MKNIVRLKEIMKTLRDPERGCPWDKKQSFQSISPYTIEEAYEVADAIERNEMGDLKEELGDLLFQVIFHSQLAEEQGHFGFDDVVDAINDKLIRRHPHVFSDQMVGDEKTVEQEWQEHKARERMEKNPSGSALHGIAATLPALRWSEKIQKRAAQAGFDWPEVFPVFEKLEEELQELKDEIDQEDNIDRIQEELGDVFFVCVNIAMHLGLSAEETMRLANRKFISRFITMERVMKQNDDSFENCSIDQLESYWQKAKKILEN